MAAPIAMVGYAFMDADFPVWLPAADVAGTGRQLYRVNTTWVSANGATKIPEPASYVYVTPDKLHFSFNNGATSETLPGGSTVTPCPAIGVGGQPVQLRRSGGLVVLVEGRRRRHPAGDASATRTCRGARASASPGSSRC